MIRYCISVSVPFFLPFLILSFSRLELYTRFPLTNIFLIHSDICTQLCYKQEKRKIKKRFLDDFYSFLISFSLCRAMHTQVEMWCVWFDEHLSQPLLLVVHSRVHTKIGSAAVQVLEYGDERRGHGRQRIKLIRCFCGQNISVDHSIES